MRLGYALGGFMGAGKTTIGGRLAARAQLPFIDLDDVLVAQFGPIAEQFARDGEIVFRERERAAVVSLCDGVPRVLATGGGTWADPANRAALRAAYRTVVIAVPLAVAADRIGTDPTRPAWAEAAVRYAQRIDAYADAELIVDGQLDPDVIVEEILCHPWS